MRNVCSSLTLSLKVYSLSQTRLFLRDPDDLFCTFRAEADPQTGRPMKPNLQKHVFLLCTFCMEAGPYLSRERLTHQRESLFQRSVEHACFFHSCRAASDPEAVFCFLTKVCFLFTFPEAFAQDVNFGFSCTDLAHKFLFWACSL